MSAGSGAGAGGTLTCAARTVRGHLLREDPGRVGGEERSGSGAGLALAEEAAEGALHRVMLLHRAGAGAGAGAGQPRRGGTGAATGAGATAGRGRTGPGPTFGPSFLPGASPHAGAAQQLPPGGWSPAGLYRQGWPRGVPRAEQTQPRELLRGGPRDPGRSWYKGPHLRVARVDLVSDCS